MRSDFSLRTNNRKENVQGILLSIQKGNGKKWYIMLGKSDISKETKNKQNKEDTESCKLTARGYLSACISKND